MNGSLQLTICEVIYVAGARWNRLANTVLTITINLCLGAEIKKILYASKKPTFHFYKVEFTVIQITTDLLTLLYKNI